MHQIQDKHKCNYEAAHGHCICPMAVILKEGFVNHVTILIPDIPLFRF